MVDGTAMGAQGVKQGVGHSRADRVGTSRGPTLPLLASTHQSGWVEGRFCEMAMLIMHTASYPFELPLGT